MNMIYIDAIIHFMTNESDICRFDVQKGVMLWAFARFLKEIYGRNVSAVDEEYHLNSQDAATHRLLSS